MYPSSVMVSWVMVVMVIAQLVRCRTAVQSHEDLVSVVAIMVLISFLVFLKSYTLSFGNNDSC